MLTAFTRHRSGGGDVPMGYKLRREVRDALPPGVLTAAERLLVLELADVCGDDTREGWPGAAKLAELTDLSERSIQETLSRVGRKWIELRVKLGEKDGRPVYAYAGKRTTFRFPPMPRREGATDPGSLGATDPGSFKPNGAMDPGERCDGSVQEVRQIRGPSPQGTSSKSNHSSLSPRQDDSDASSPAEPERENDEASQEPKTNNPIHHLLIKNGCPAEQTEHVKARIDVLKNVQGDGFYFTADSNHSLRLAVGEALEDLNTTPARSCDACNDTGTTGDWMNPHPCNCLWWKDPEAARKAFVAQLKDFPDCEHGTAGGDVKAPTGWQHCSLCRGPGWVDKDVQPRTEKSANNGRYQPWRPPADQSAYDRPFSGQIRSPADRIVADNQALYDHYKNLEESA